jgi:transposase-like protein
LRRPVATETIFCVSVLVMAKSARLERSLLEPDKTRGIEIATGEKSLLFFSSRPVPTRLGDMTPSTKKPAVTIGSTIQVKPDFCPLCDGRQIIKRGLRKNSFRHLQIYLCKDCGKYFSSLAGLKGVKYPPRVIARALCLYNLGHSQGQTARRLASERRITVPRRTISDWVGAYRSIVLASLTGFRTTKKPPQIHNHSQPATIVWDRKQRKF